MGEDDAPGERGTGGWTAKFPHPLGAAGDAAYYAHLMQSPYMDQQLEQMAEAAVDEMKLGTEDRTDFLGVSFSSLDSVGHTYGPRSHEIQDMLVRLDITLGKLLDYLDKKVGADNYVVALSADHGVADLPEQIPAGGRQPTADGARDHRGRRSSRCSAARAPTSRRSRGGDVYFMPGVYDRLKEDRTALRGGDRRRRGAARRGARLHERRDLRRRRAQLEGSANPRRGAQLLSGPERRHAGARQRELAACRRPAPRTARCYDYDKRVPVILYGAGIRAGAREEAATPADLAVTVASHGRREAPLA